MKRRNERRLKMDAFVCTLIFFFSVFFFGFVLNFAFACCFFVFVFSCFVFHSRARFSFCFSFNILFSFRCILLFHLWRFIVSWDCGSLCNICIWLVSVLQSWKKCIWVNFSRRIWWWRLETRSSPKSTLLSIFLYQFLRSS